MVNASNFTIAKDGDFDYEPATVKTRSAVWVRRLAGWMIPLAFAHPVASLGGEDRDEATVSFSLNSSKVSLGEPLILQVRVRNEGTRTLIFDLGADDKENLRVIVTAPDGARTPPLAWHARGFGVGGRRPIRVGEVCATRIILDEWYGFDQVGDYNIDIDLVDALWTETGDRVDALRSAPLTVQVEPADEARLQEACEGLTAEILRGDSTKASFEAARALSYLRSSGAIACLRSVLSRTRNVDALLIHRLARVRTDEVRRLLASLAEEGGERAELAKGALAGMEPTRIAPLPGSLRR